MWDAYHSKGLNTNFKQLFSDYMKISHLTYFYFRAALKSEGNIAIVKKFDFDFLIIFASTSLQRSKNVF